MSDTSKDKDRKAGDKLLKRMLKTPPKPKRARESINYLVLEGRLLVADILKHDGNSITADLYRNPKEFLSGAAMERNVKLDV